jgi:lysozyme
MKTESRGIALIKSYEKLVLTAYHGEADPPNIWTIGWGHTFGVKEGMVIDQQTAEVLLEQDISDAEDAVAGSANLSITTQAQFDAMVSFAFNLGTGAFKRSTLLRMHNSGDFFGAGQQFQRWVFANGQKRRGLFLRRSYEAALYAEDRFLEYKPEEG